MTPRFGDAGRTYARPDSHPWITFSFRLNSLSQLDFVHLGEALSKCDHLAGVPLPPAVARELHQIYLAKGIHATTQIEGNTLSEAEVKRRIEGDLRLPASQEYLGREIDNVLGACNLILHDLAAGNEMHLTRQRIEHFNAMVLDGLPLDEGVEPGAIRRNSVLVGNVYRGAPAQDCAFLLDELCGWLEQLLADAAQPWGRPVRLIRAILAHLYLAWIHPFGDGNGRTARLVEFQLLAEAGFPSPACHLLSDYYNRTRQAYYRVLRETSRRPYPVERFISYALQGFAEELREQLGVVQNQELRNAWFSFVHEFDLGSTDSTARRRRALVLSLPIAGAEVTRIPRLTPDLAALYADKTRKTLTRDVNALVAADLIVAEGTRVRPHLERLLSFLPLQKVAM